MSKTNEFKLFNAFAVSNGEGRLLNKRQILIYRYQALAAFLLVPFFGWVEVFFDPVIYNPWWFRIVICVIALFIFWWSFKKNRSIRYLEMFTFFGYVLIVSWILFLSYKQNFLVRNVLAQIIIFVAMASGFKTKKQYYFFSFFYTSALLTALYYSSIKLNEATYFAAIEIGIQLFLYLMFSAKNKSEENFVKSLTEKEALLKEIHHRIKNNLQVVSSMLFLQSKDTHQIETEKILEDSRQRVQTIALIHQMLHDSASFKTIDLALFLKKRIDHVSYKNNTYAHRFLVKGDAIQIDIDIAIPLGLILNELIFRLIDSILPVHGNIQIELKKRKKIDIVIKYQPVEKESVELVLSDMSLRLLDILMKQLRVVKVDNNQKNTLLEIQL